jgi:transposase
MKPSGAQLRDGRRDRKTIQAVLDKVIEGERWNALVGLHVPLLVIPGSHRPCFHETGAARVARTIAKVIRFATRVGADLDLIKRTAATAVDQQWIIRFSD